MITESGASARIASSTRALVGTWAETGLFTSCVIAESDGEQAIVPGCESLNQGATIIMMDDLSEGESPTGADDQICIIETSGAGELELELLLYWIDQVDCKVYQAVGAMTIPVTE